MSAAVDRAALVSVIDNTIPEGGMAWKLAPGQAEAIADAVLDLLGGVEWGVWHTEAPVTDIKPMTRAEAFDHVYDTGGLVVRRTPGDQWRLGPQFRGGAS